MSLADGFVARGVAPRGTRLLLIRHGEARCNVEGVIGGPRGDGGLTDRGRAQARALSERLVRTGELAASVALYTSVLDRSIETAEILRPALGGREAVPDCDLCELHPGEGDALSWEEYGRRFGVPDFYENPDAALAPGEESWRDFHHRVEGVIARLVARHPGDLVVGIVHGGVIEQAMVGVSGVAPGSRLGLRTEHCSMTEIEYDGPRRRLLRYNDVVPLAPE